MTSTSSSLHDDLAEQFAGITLELEYEIGKDYTFKDDEESFEYFKNSIDLEDFLDSYLDEYFFDELGLEFNEGNQHKLLREAYSIMLKNQIEAERTLSVYESYELLGKVLAEGGKDKGIVSLLNFEDCGSCAGAVINDVYRPDPEVNGVVTFNHQTWEKAHDRGELLLTIFSLSEGYSDEWVISQVENILNQAGFVFVPGEYDWDKDYGTLKFKEYKRVDGIGLVIMGLWWRKIAS